MFLDIVLLLIGIAIVIWGADKFTDGASSMARRWNVSEMVIGNCSCHGHQYARVCGKFL